MMKDMELAAYEGLIFSTAAMYEHFLDDDIEDIQQVLRLKAWRALAAFDPKRNRAGVRSFVFSCVRNEVKDLVKSQSRRDRRRDGRQLYIEELTEADEHALHFEARYLSESGEQAYHSVEEQGLDLPPSLTADERSVVHLLLLDLNQTEIAATLKITRLQVRRLHSGIQDKVRSWKSESEAVAA